MSRVEPEQAFEELSDHILGRVNVALPGVVESYDVASNTALVRPAVWGHYIKEDTEERIAEKPTPIPRVPVARPQFGSYFELECPLQAGDHVLLLVCDRSIDEYVQTGQASNVPQDVRRFDWTDAVALPVWVRTQTEATTKVKVEADGTITVEGTNIKLGDGASEAVLKGDTLLSLLYAAFDAHVHTDPVSGNTGVPTVLWNKATGTDPLDAARSAKVETE